MRAALFVHNPKMGLLWRSAQAVSPASEATPGAHLDAAVTLWLRRSAQTTVVGEIALAAGDARAHALNKSQETERVALLVPSFLDGELAAVLVLGEKLSGEYFQP